MRRTVSLLLLCVASPALIGSVGLRTNFEGRLLAAHNRERAALGVPALQWSDALAADAQRWATELGRAGRFEHSPDEPGAEPQGENLWAGTRGHYAPEAMVGLWIAEKKHFQPGLFPSNSRTGRVQDVSHYTQLAWRESGAIGCALAQGPREDVLVCRYSQAGNVIGRRPF
jgi:hypothetical protein